MVRALILGVAAAALLLACGEEAKPVSWYLEHPQALRARVAWCADDSARKPLADCQNALFAAGRQAQGMMKDAPPLDWNTRDPKAASAAH